MSLFSFWWDDVYLYWVKLEMENFYYSNSRWKENVFFFMKFLMKRIVFCLIIGFFGIVIVCFN